VQMKRVVAQIAQCEICININNKKKSPTDRPTDQTKIILYGKHPDLGMAMAVLSTSTYFTVCMHACAPLSPLLFRLFQGQCKPSLRQPVEDNPIAGRVVVAWSRTGRGG
jgi:hypothetical protein